MLFMAIVIPVTIEGLSVANRAGMVAERRRVAAQLADNMLTELLVTGQWSTGGQAGNFGEDHPGFRWELKTENWTEESMRLLTLRVWFKVQEKDYEVHLSTLVDGEAS